MMRASRPIPVRSSVRVSVRASVRAAIVGLGLLALAGCEADGTFDPDFRQLGTAGGDTTAAARQASAPRPAADARGIISYPTYQVVIARPGDTVQAVATRIGIAAPQLASYNAIAETTVLQGGEVLVLPTRVAGGAVAGGAPAIGTLPQGGVATGGGIDVTSIASGAIDRAESGGTVGGTGAARPATAEPTRHKVERGETAFSVARLYSVDVRALAEWNGLGSDLAVREGQVLLIPVADRAAPPPTAATAVTTAPGTGSPTPLPPSAKEPLPAEKPVAANKTVPTPPAPDLGAQQTAASGAKLAMPVQGKIIRGYQKKKNEGIDIGAAAGTPVKAAADGTVAAITKDTDQVPILVIRHDGNLLTVYANIDGITVEKGARVKRGQQIAKVRASDPAFLHFEVRQGFDSVDPVPFLQ
jgi:murein DD-endopeptidase MepM/ murein hydrolase activator NlpD